jgi:hypothetical protein
MRPSWTSKLKLAASFETAEEAAAVACRILKLPRSRGIDRVQWVSGQHGYVIYDFNNKRMLADRSLG